MRKGWLLLVLAIALLTTPLYEARPSPPPIRGEVQTTGTLAIDGESKATTRLGVLHLPGTTDPGVAATIEAASATITYDWETAKGVGRDGQDPIAYHFTGQGQNATNFTNLSARIAPAADGLELLALSTTIDSTINARMSGSAQARTATDETLTDVGDSENTYTTGDARRIGFSYTVDGPWPALDELDTALVRGTFVLFVNNATVNVQSNETMDWHHWTGHRTEPSAGPAIHESERRVTIIEVVDGLLSVTAQNGLTLMGPTVNATVTGGITAADVRGRLSTTAHEYILDKAQLELLGSGELGLRAMRAGGIASGTLTSSATPTLESSIQGTFNVEDRPGVQVQKLSSTSEGPLSQLLDWLPWLALTAVGLFATVSQKEKMDLYLAKKQAERRQERETLWRKTGDRLFEAREFAQALRWYERIVDNYPNSLEGRHSVANALGELERYDEASQCWEEVARMLNDDATYLASAAVYAWKDGDEDRAVALAIETCQLDLASARARFDTPNLRELWEHPRVREEREGDVDVSVGGTYV